MTRLGRAIVVACSLALYPSSAGAQEQVCAGLQRGRKVRLTVPQHAWKGAIRMVTTCSADALDVTDGRKETLRIDWDAITRLEAARRRDLRWPGLAAGLAAGVALGRKIPLDEPGSEKVLSRRAESPTSTLGAVVTAVGWRHQGT